MKCLKRGYQKLQDSMNLGSKWMEIPDILKMKLLMTAGLMVAILGAGVLMEYQNGNGFLKLSCLCCFCLGIHFLNLFWTVYKKKYDTLEGEVVLIQMYKKRKKCWEVIVRDSNGQDKQIFISSQSKIRKGTRYRFFWKGDELLGIEEQAF